MKLISEYGFRELIGHFFKMNFPKGKNFIDRNCEDFLVYVYIDPETGINLEIIGEFIDGKAELFRIISHKLRYSDDFMLEAYGNTDNETLEQGKTIEKQYTPDWIVPVRENTLYDPYRDKIFPDDMLLMIATIYEGKLEFESLWVRPVMVSDDNVFCETIENGKILPKGTQAAVMSNAVLGGRAFYDLPDIIAIDPLVADFVVKWFQEHGNR